MTTQTVEFARSIDEQVTVTATGRAGWVTGLFVAADNTRQYNVSTTEASGKPVQAWYRADDLADATPDATPTA